jgi:protein-disulfide isomerase
MSVPYPKQRHAPKKKRAVALPEQQRLGRKPKQIKVVLGLIALVAIAAVGAVALNLGSGSDEPSAGSVEVGNTAEVAEMLEGIPQSGATLGRADAPVTLVEYADLQCPFCAEWARNALPTLAWDYVRAGKLKIEFRGLTFVGEDSDKALRFALAAGEQNKLWHAVELLYWNQGAENTGWVTDARLDAVAAAIGLDGAALRARGDKTPVVHAIAESTTAARDDGVSSTPTILIGPSGGTLEHVQLSGLGPEGVVPAIKAVLARK